MSKDNKDSLLLCFRYNSKHTLKMEVSVPLNSVNMQNIYFAEKKKNVIVDGDFIKIIYSTSGFEMNGLYILFGIETLKDTFSTAWTQTPVRSPQLTSKKIITFDPYSEINFKLISRLCEIEREIIERYILNKCKSKYPSYILKTQLLCGTIKYHSEYKEVTSKSYSSQMNYHPLRENIYPVYRMGIRGNKNTTERLILKISGIWETNTNVGITMKFISLQDCY